MVNRIVLMVLAAVALTGARVDAQAVPPQVLEDSYAFCASRAVATDAEEQLVFMGAGPGIHVLDGTSDQPTPAGAGIATDRLRTEGFVRDMVVTDDTLFVAADLGGLQAFDRTEYLRLSTLQLAAPVQTVAFALDVVTAEGTGKTFALVGTHEGLEFSSGALYLVDVSNPSTPIFRDSFPLGSNVYAVKAIWNMVPGSISVFVGTACGDATNGCQSLRRFEIDPSPVSPEIVATAEWPVAGCAPGEEYFVRDVVLDVTFQRAYVAAYRKGVLEFDLSGGLLSQVVCDPIAPAELGRNLCALTLALVHPDHNTTMLAVGYGTKFAVDWQWWGNPNMPTSCDDSSRGNSFEGVVLFTKSPPSAAVFVEQGSFAVDPAQLPKAPVALDARVSQEFQQVRLDVACDVEGLVVLKASLIGGSWELSRVGDWDADNFPNGPGVEDVAGGSCDDVIQIGDFVYASLETKLLTFATDGPDAVLDEFVDLDTVNASAILLAGFEADGNQPAMLYSHIQEHGVRFFNLSAEDGLPVPYSTLLNTSGRGYCLFPIVGLDGNRWLYVVNQGDDDAGTGPPGIACVDDGPGITRHGGIRVYRVGPVANPANAVLLGEFTPCDNYVQAHGTYIDCVVVVTEGKHAVWVTYGPDGVGNAGGITEPNAGLMVLEATYDGTGVDFSLVTKVPFAGSDPFNGATARLTYDAVAAPDVLYAAHGCHGVARYDVTNRLAPLAAGEYVFDPPSTPNKPKPSALKVWPAANGFVYVSLLHDGVLILPDILTGGFERIWRLPGDANAFLPATSSGLSAGSAVIVANGRGGLARVQFFDFD